MRVSFSFALLGLLAVSCCLNSDAVRLRSRCDLTFRLDNQEEFEQDDAARDVHLEDVLVLEWRAHGEYTVHVSLDAVRARLRDSNKKVADEMRNGPYDLKAYGVHVHPNGTYTEFVGISSSYRMRGGADARMYMQTEVYPNEVYRPFLFVFDVIQRLVSPHGVLAGVLDRTLHTNATGYVRESEWSVLRNYKFNIEDKSTDAYSDDALAKMFTKVPADVRQEDSKRRVFRMARHQTSRLATVLAQAQDTSDRKIAYMRPVAYSLYGNNMKFNKDAHPFVSMRCRPSPRSYPEDTADIDVHHTQPWTLNSSEVFFWDRDD